jgi:hypothetical protein
MVSARKTCRKTRFNDEIAASKWLKRMLNYVTTNGDVVGHVPQRVYECPICGGFHATSRK